MTANPQETKMAIRAELEATRTTFHALLASLSENDLSRPSQNSGWANCEILVHMLFGFIILNALLPMARIWGHLPRWSSRPLAWLLNAFTGPFNWINALGARLQARIFTGPGLGRVFDRAYSSLIRQIDSIQSGEWDQGMYYPTRWDSNFSNFMTIEKLLHYMVAHFHFHMRQIAH